LAAPAVPQGEQGALAQLVELVRRRPPPPGVLRQRPRARSRVRAGRARAARGADGGAAARLDRERRAELVPGVRGAARPLSRDRARHARPCERHAQLERFKLRDCADDVAALLRKKRISNAILVGYSMGGPIAQLVWKRHPDLVAGMVLAATSAQLARNNGFGLLMAGIMEARRSRAA
jgi:dienelactone hydrolase